MPSSRLQHWNYSSEGMYFVTICTKNRENYFGEIIDCVLHPTQIGEIAYSEWIKTSELRPDMNLKPGEFVVMPDHIHGIVIIGPNKYNIQNRYGRDAMHCVSTDNKTNIGYKNQFTPQRKNLSSIIRGYKIAVTTFARKNGIEFE